jgi:hypothetical protein
MTTWQDNIYSYYMINIFLLHAVTDVHGRTFGVWTLLTCTLCFLCALNLENRPLYIATFLSFIYALGHFLTEYLIYHTMAVANLSMVGFFAGTAFAFYVHCSFLFQLFLNFLFIAWLVISSIAAVRSQKLVGYLSETEIFVGFSFRKYCYDMICMH